MTRSSPARLLRPAGLLAALLLVAGCSDSGGSSDDVSREEMRDDVRATTQEVVEMLGAADLEPLAASGSYSTCGAPEPGYEYGAGARLRPAGDIGAAVESAEEILVDDGWEVDASGQGEVPFVNVTKGPLRVSVKASQVDEGDVSTEVVHTCVPGDTGDTPSFDDERIDVGG